MMKPVCDRCGAGAALTIVYLKARAGFRFCLFPSFSAGAKYLDLCETCATEVGLTQ